MGLVVVAAIGGQGGAWLFGMAAQGLQYMLKAADALEGFGGEAGLFAEEFFEMARADADAVDDVLHTSVGCRLAKSRGGEGYCWMQKWSALEAGKKRLFKNGKHRGDTLRVEQFFTGQCGVRRPDLIESIGAMRDFAGRHAEEGECAAGPELDADDALLFAGIEQETIGARATKDSGGVGCWLADIN